jgi:hypothetical protein
MSNQNMEKKTQDSQAINSVVPKPIETKDIFDGILIKLKIFL